MSQAALLTLLRTARYEVLPTAGIVDRIEEYIVPGREITVTASTGLSLEATLSTAEQLQALGFRAVPHLAARMLRDPGEVAEVLARLGEAGVREVFVIAGDAPHPAGRFEGALDLLEVLSPSGMRAGIGAHPEGHP